MPMPTLLCLAFASGVAAALAGRAELRISPRPLLLTQSAGAWLAFGLFVLVPVSVYFYLFHGDWFLLYAVDIRRVPSAVALLGFLGELALGVAGFVLGGALVRAQRDSIAGGVIGATCLAAVIAVVVSWDRLAVVGSYAQYEGGFGLSPFGSGALLSGTVAMGLILIAGLGYLLGRLVASSRRV